MRISKTTIVLVCLSAVYNLQAQFEKSDWLLEGGIQTHLGGSFGKKDIDLSQGSFKWYSNFDLNLRNIINPNISIFWTFHGKSKKDRD